MKSLSSIHQKESKPPEPLLDKEVTKVSLLAILGWFAVVVLVAGFLYWSLSGASEPCHCGATTMSGCAKISLDECIANRKRKSR